MADILKGAPVAAAITEDLTARCNIMKVKGIMPTLAMVRIGQRPDDLSYQNAAMKRCEKVGIAVHRMVGRMADSFMNGRRVFQIDGNMGGTAGIAEALLQSHAGLIDLLPALPPTWTKGAAMGFKARGNVEVDMIWEDHALTKAALRPALDGKLEIRAKGMKGLTVDGREVPAEKTEYGFAFDAQAGREYALVF